MERMVHREDVLKDLWAVLEKTPKVLKDMSGNLITKDTRQSMFRDINRVVEYIPIVEELVIDAFYKHTAYGDKEEIVGKLLGFAYIEDNLRIKLRILYASKKNMSYFRDIKDHIYLEISNIRGWEIEEIKYEDLPLFAGNEFTGTLLSEMIKKGEQGGQN